MAQFNNAYYNYTKPFEGGYANVANDKGQETYAGISRRFYPNEIAIWSFIDKIKQSRVIKNNELFPELTNAVTNFYKKIWDKNRLGEINSQAVANLLYDYIVHSGSGTAVKAIQRIVITPADGIIGDHTIHKINSLPDDVVFSNLLKQRTDFLKSLIDKDPTQEDFRKGWMARMQKFADDFNNLLKQNRGLTLLGVAVIICLMVFLHLMV